MHRVSFLQLDYFSVKPFVFRRSAYLQSALFLTARVIRAVVCIIHTTDETTDTVVWAGIAIMATTKVMMTLAELFVRYERLPLS
ncbi:hypothetical protein [Psychrobacter alimentarius]|uniref:hypothetical protein n=1 Tax=Psychrobacter alimentarius TaxID=261164 RepID=UPI003FD5534E